jgi:ribonuclease HIII
LNAPTSVTAKLDRARAEAIRREMASGGWTFDAEPPEHALWSARLTGVRAVMYGSGKLVLQGKDAPLAAEEYLGGGGDGGGAPAPVHGIRLRVPTAGSDETGKGDFLGPLVVAAALVRPGQEALLAEYGVRDSKRMTDRQAAEAAALLRETVPSEVVVIQPPRYNELHAEMGANLNRLLAWAHGKALETLLSRPECGDARAVVVDRFAKGPVLRRALGPRTSTLPLEERPGAESNPAVAAASVLARDAFLAALRRLGDEVGVPLHKGAGAPTDAAARRVLAKGGPALLARVAKMHFRNAEKVGAR